MNSFKYLWVMALAFAFAASSVSAQETYQSAKLVDNELNGTARYVGMGGALEALGADISTISTNPAGIGLFRSSQFAISGGLVAQSDDNKSHFSNENGSLRIDGNKTNASFDQVGFVWANRTGNHSFLNLSFNYHKSRNFDELLNASANFLLRKDANGNTYAASQNKNTVNRFNYALDMQQQGYDHAGDYLISPLDRSYMDLLEYDSQKGYAAFNADSYLFGQYQKGYIGEYDVNVSGNINDRIYLGLTVGFRDVHYRSRSQYGENLLNGGIAGSEESLRITGEGFDFKFGAIFRPFEASPFRVGVYVHTPTFYDLDLDGSVVAYLDGLEDTNTDQGPVNGERYNSVSNSFRVNTPWRFGLSLGNTIGNFLALGATYEYSDYSHLDNRIKDGYYGEYWENSSSDGTMNDNTRLSLRGMSTLKLGVEYKPMSDLALRIGYNYLSPMFKKDGLRDPLLFSDGNANSTSTDYTNWKATNRFTFGVGYQISHWNIDFAYQYSATRGDFYPFATTLVGDAANSSDNEVYPAKVKFDRSQLLFTLGYRF